MLPDGLRFAESIDDPSLAQVRTREPQEVKIQKVYQRLSSSFLPSTWEAAPFFLVMRSLKYRPIKTRMCHSYRQINHKSYCLSLPWFFPCSGIVLFSCSIHFDMMVKRQNSYLHKFTRASGRVRGTRTRNRIMTVIGWHLSELFIYTIRPVRVYCRKPQA